MDITGIVGILEEDLPDCQIKTCRRNFALDGEEPYWGNSFYVFHGEAGIETHISDILRLKLNESAVHSVARVLHSSFDLKD